MTKLACQTWFQLLSLEHRIAALERRQAHVAQPAAPMQPPVVFDLDMVVGDVIVGGSAEQVTMRGVYAKLAALDTKVDISMDRTMGKGFTLHEWSFSSELEFTKMFVDANASGAGPAAFVDMILIWVHASLHQAPTEDWLQAHHRSLVTGFMNPVDSEYASTMRNAYLQIFVGSTKSILPTKVLQCFSSMLVWRGTGIGDGTRERI